MTTNPTITQADKDMAFLWKCRHLPRLFEDAPASLPEAFARHREQAVAEKDKRIEELRAENARLRGRIADMEHLLTGARNLLCRLPSDVFGHAYEDHVYIPRSSMPPRSWDIEAKPVSVRDHFLAEVHKALRQPKEQDDDE